MDLLSGVAVCRHCLPRVPSLAVRAVHAGRSCRPTPARRAAQLQGLSPLTQPDEFQRPMSAPDPVVASPASSYRPPDAWLNLLNGLTWALTLPCEVVHHDAAPPSL